MSQQGQLQTQATPSSVQQPVVQSSAQHVEPNLFELSNDEMQITYSSTSFTGQAQLNYHTHASVLTFQGQDIRVEKSELGTLVTVSIIRTVDTGYSSLTLLLPHVNLAGSNQQNISTVVILTRHLFGILPHAGAQELYTVQNVQGVALFVEF
ncbi:MAG: hypothetical protein PVS3B3_12890 [Ktedonobacteraceae bacterium]